ncbi:MAG TPA: uracil phosphoribosyltransferase, partial [Acidimicrobiia bacterium]|nr:uracil phosphoribosyltransferase [Acidimicrobiia bacterium]
MADNVTVLDHPLIQHKLTLMRRKDTPSADFRRLLREIAGLMTYEVTRDLPIELERIETPIGPMDAPVIEGKKLAAISILRAGNGLLDGILDLVPAARVGHIGLYRDPETLQAVEYYFKVPEEMHDRDVIVVDPMLATGHSAAAALDRIKETGPRSIRFLCLLAAPEGIEHLAERH